MKRFLSCLAADMFAGIYTRFNRITPIATSMITENVFAVRTGTVNFYIYKDDNNAVCFDSGFGAAVISRELNGIGIAPESISHIFLTHSDFDHSGGISVFKNAEIYLSAQEERMITGKTARKFGFIYNSRIKRVFHLLTDNEVVNIGVIKIKAIETPGHTPGSMCYAANDSLLFTGDAFRIINGKVQPIRRIFTMDMEQQIKSIKKLARLKSIDMVFTAHRGYLKDFDSAIRYWR